MSGNQVPVLENPTRDGFRKHLEEASSELNMAIASAGEKGGNVFHTEGFVLGKRGRTGYLFLHILTGIIDWFP